MVAAYMTVEEILGSEDLPALKVDETGLVLDANPAFSSEFGFSRQDLVGQPLTIMIPPHLRTSHYIGFSRFVATGKATFLGQEVVLPFLTADGQERLVNAYIEGERRDGRWLFAALLTPFGQ